MSKAKFNASDIELAMAQFMANAAVTETPGAGHNGDIIVYGQLSTKENENGCSEAASDECG